MSVENKPKRRGRWKPGESGNPGGRPKGSRTFAVKRMVAKALSDPAVEAEAIRQLQSNFQGKKTVVPALEFAARVNKEIGLGSGDVMPGMTINVFTNLRPGRLKRVAGGGA